ncbi:JAB domain-containing protein [Rufibacter sp. XAAS-G3-1]|uniref:JAB domain-containing protein n=1 Tax=Rufibacter sp. XAAS-G3-1 TaxID=2729134 RepID=UPI002105A69C|nr:JAB domain-containing protein [Rufibacter sp. XAAS-G3-1]
MTIYNVQSETSNVNENANQLNSLQEILKAIPQIKLSYKLDQPASSLMRVTCSADVEKAFRASWDEDNIEFVEEFKVMFLNRGNRILGICEISKGGYSGTVADPKLILSAALLTACSGIILAHNHPSGQLKPSAADLTLTNKMKQGAELLDMVLLDHLILTKEGHYSFADEGDV